MDQARYSSVAGSAKPEFEPSELIEYGEAEQLTQSAGGGAVPDATYQS